MFNRRQTLQSFLAGLTGVHLRALATGLPAAFLLNPRRALSEGLAACGDRSKAQFFILSTSAQGDAINANVPGSFVPQTAHSADPQMVETPFRLGSIAVRAAKPWSTLPQAVLDRSGFWHLKTNTVVHSEERDVLGLMGGIRPSEMLPSLLSKHLASCLQTIQSQPITVGAPGPVEGLSFGGASLPILPPVALKDTLLAPTGALASLQPLRDKTLTDLSSLLRSTATKAQRSYLDSLILSQQQVRSIPQNLLTALNAIDDNSPDNQIAAAVALIRMKVTPVVAIHLPFSGDNHTDDDLARETSQTVSSVATIASLMAQLSAAGLQDQVSFVTLNVFGRTLGASSLNGRNHNLNHQASVVIGKPFRAGVVGGVAPVAGDFGAVAIDSATGAASASGDISPNDSLASFGKTLLAAVGVDVNVREAMIPEGRVIAGGLV